MIKEKEDELAEIEPEFKEKKTNEEEFQARWVSEKGLGSVFIFFNFLTEWFLILISGL